MLSERTKLSGMAVEFVGDLVILLRDKFDGLIDACFVPLLKLCMRSNKVFVNRATCCATKVLTWCRSARYFDKLIEYSTSSNKSVRICVAECFSVLLQLYSAQFLHEYCPLLVNYLTNSLADATVEVRDHSKKAFLLFQTAFPQESQL